MPCSDQTEILHLEVNDQDEIISFDLQKLSCGRTVGGDLLFPFVKSLPISTLLKVELSELLSSSEEMEQTVEFLLYKQFYSLRAACSVLLGLRSGQVEEPFVLEEVYYEEGVTSIKGFIAIDLIQKEIKACGHCGTGCATTKKSKKKEQQTLDRFLQELTQENRVTEQTN